MESEQEEQIFSNWVETEDTFTHTAEYEDSFRTME